MARNRVSWVDKWGGFSEGKIKGMGQNHLSHCLHIVFSGTRKVCSGTRNRRDCPWHLRKVPGHDPKKATFRNLSLF